jgi:prevent-host-death family protein
VARSSTNFRKYGRFFPEAPFLEVPKAVKVSVTEARNRLSELLREVETGAVIVVVRHGVPVARLQRVLVKKSTGEADSLVDFLDGLKLTL